MTSTKYPLTVSLICLNLAIAANILGQAVSQQPELKETVEFLVLAVPLLLTFSFVVRELISREEAEAAVKTFRRIETAVFYAAITLTLNLGYISGLPVG